MLEKIQTEDGFFKKHHSHVLSTISKSQLQDFASCTEDDERFNFVFKLPATRELRVQNSPVGKNVDIARKLKDEGNKAFQSGDYTCAIQLYTKSIMKAPWNTDSTQDLAVAVANRSAAFYHLEQHLMTINDVELVLSLDYPLELRYKVLDRKARCLLARKQLKDALLAFRATLTALDSAKIPKERKQKWQMDVQVMLCMLGQHKDIANEPLNDMGRIPLPPLSGGCNPLYQSASSAIQILQSPEMGRFAEAAQYITVGDILVTEQAFCSVLLSEYTGSHCFHCFKRLIAPVPCPRCSSVAFCTVTCQQEALSSHHSVECGVLPLLWASGASVTCLMALRIVSQHGLQYFLDRKHKLKQVPKVYRGSDYISVYNLVRHEDKRTADDLFHRADMAVFLLRCLQVAGFFREQLSETGGELTEEETFIGGLLLRHLQLLQFNAHEMAELQLEKNGNLNSGRSVFLGGGVFPTLALFNHSCDPGVVRYFLGTCVVVRAIKNINSGEMVAENYGPIFTQVVQSERQTTLKNQYWFDCTCIPCSENWPCFNDMDTSTLRFKCDNSDICTNVLRVPMDTMEFMLQCPECKEHINILKGLKALQSTDGMFKIAKHMMDNKEVSKALGKFIEILIFLDKSLAPPYRDYHLCQQAIRQCMLSLGNVCVKSS